MYPTHIVSTKGNKKITMITAYDYSMAGIINDTDIDIILVGDSLGNVILGHKDTIAVTLNDMIHHASAVVRGAPDKMVIVDMPFMSISMGISGGRSRSRSLFASWPWCWPGSGSSIFSCRFKTCASRCGRLGRGR